MKTSTQTIALSNLEAAAQAVAQAVTSTDATIGKARQTAWQGIVDASKKLGGKLEQGSDEYTTFRKAVLSKLVAANPDATGNAARATNLTKIAVFLSHGHAFTSTAESTAVLEMAAAIKNGVPFYTAGTSGGKPAKVGATPKSGAPVDLKALVSGLAANPAELVAMLTDAQQIAVYLEICKAQKVKPAAKLAA